MAPIVAALASTGRAAFMILTTSGKRFLRCRGYDILIAFGFQPTDVSQNIRASSEIGPTFIYRLLSASWPPFAARSTSSFC